MSHSSKGYLIAILATAFWSSTAIFIRYLTNDYNMQPLLLALWRDAFVVFALGIALFFFRRSLLKLQTVTWRFFLLYGGILAVFNSMWTLSVQLNGAAVSTVLAYGSAGFTALLAWWLFKEQLNLAKSLAVIFSLSGCVLVAEAYTLEMWIRNPLGIATGILSGLLFAVYSLMGKESTRRGLNSWHTLLYSFGFAVPFILLFNLIPGLPGKAESLRAILPSLPWDAWLVFIALAWIPTIGGYGLYVVSMNYLPASVANLICTLEPAMTAVQAYLLLGERLTFLQVVGSVFIICGVLLVRLSERIKTQNQISYQP